MPDKLNNACQTFAYACAIPFAIVLYTVATFVGALVTVTIEGYKGER